MMASCWRFKAFLDSNKKSRENLMFSTIFLMESYHFGRNLEKIAGISTDVEHIFDLLQANPGLYIVQHCTTLYKIEE